MPENPGQIIFRYLNCWKDANSEKAGNTVSTAHMIAWNPPLTDWVKLNVDGSMNTESRRITAGGVIRNHRKDWLGGFSLNKGIGSVQEAELWGIFEGLQLAWRSGYRRVTVNILSKPTPLNHPLFSLIQSSKSLIQKDWCCLISHAYRESNKVADCLAKMGHSLDLGITFFEDPPPQVDVLLKNDAIGLASARFFPCSV